MKEDPYELYDIGLYACYALYQQCDAISKSMIELIIKHIYG